MVMWRKSPLVWEILDLFELHCMIIFEFIAFNRQNRSYIHISGINMRRC